MNHERLKYIEKKLLDELSREGYMWTREEEFDDDGNFLGLYFKVNDMWIDFGDFVLEYGGGKGIGGRPIFSRHYELYDGLDKEEAINDYVESIIFFLKHPEMRDGPSWNPIKLFNWFLDGLGCPRTLAYYKKKLAKKQSC